MTLVLHHRLVSSGDLHFLFAVRLQAGLFASQLEQSKWIVCGFIYIYICLLPCTCVYLGFRMHCIDSVSKILLHSLDSFAAADLFVPLSGRRFYMIFLLHQ